MKLLVAGAGIAGLATAIILARAGHRLQILEARKEDELLGGAGIQLSANACRVLAGLGLLKQIQSKAVSPNQIMIRQHDSGRCIKRIPAGWMHRLAFGAPYLHVHRGDLYALMLRTAIDTPGIELMFGSEISGFEQGESTLQLRLTAGRIMEADGLIGADGIRSEVAAAMHAGHRQVFSGQYAWRGVVDAARLGPDFMPKVVSNFVGPGAHVVLYYIDAGRLLNMVAVVADQQPPQGIEQWTVAASWSSLRQRLSGWHADVHKVLDQLDDQPCFKRALFEQPCGERFHQQRVALVGDAAHGALPSMAQGAAMALEDAWVLGRCLALHDIEAGFALYSRSRQLRCQQIQSASRRLGDYYHNDNAALLGVLNGRLEPDIRRTVINAYRYDALNAPLVAR